MKIILNLEKVKDVRVYGIEKYCPQSVSLYVNYYDNENRFEYTQSFKDLCESSIKGIIEKVQKAYDKIKQALFKGEKIIEIIL